MIGLFIKQNKRNNLLFITKRNQITIWPYIQHTCDKSLPWLCLMQAEQTYSWVLTSKYTFHGTKHSSQAFSNQQRKTRTMEKNQLISLWMPHSGRYHWRKCRRCSFSGVRINGYRNFYLVHDTKTQGTLPFRYNSSCANILRTTQVLQ